MKLRAGVLVLCCAALAGAAETTSFESFFLTVAQSKQAAAAPLADPEANTLVAIASDYAKKSFALGHSGIVFEARLRAIASNSTEDAAAWEAEQIRAIERRRAELLADHIRQLKDAFGPARFAALEDYVEMWHKAMLATPRPQAKK